MVCRNCGTTNSDKALFCSGCGARFDMAQNQVHTTGESSPEKHRNRKFGIISVVSLAVVALAIGIALVFWSNHTDAKERTPETVISSFCTAINNTDAKAIIDLLPEDVVGYFMNEEGMTRRELIADLQQYIDNSEIGYLKKHDSSFRITHLIISTQTHYDLESLQEEYAQVGITVTDAVTVSTQITLISKEETDSDLINLVAIKVNGFWYISIDNLDSIF